jgi:hypothetical protein
MSPGAPFAPQTPVGCTFGTPVACGPYFGVPNLTLALRWAPEPYFGHYFGPGGVPGAVLGTYFVLGAVPGTVP